MRITIPIVLMTFFASAASASEPITIDRALDLMLRENLSLKSLRQEAVKAYASRVAADGLWTPEVGITGTADIQSESQTNDGSDRRDGRSARASLSQTLYSGGRNSALIRQSKQTAEIADLTLINGENLAAGELFARFYNVILQAGRVEASRAAIAVSEAHLREIERMSELGLSNRLEVIRASGALATNRAGLAAAEGLYDSAHISLMNYINIAPADRLPVDGELNVIMIEGSRERSLALAMERRADRRIISTRVGYRENQVEIERSALRPRVTLGASAGWSNPYKSQDRSGDTWRAELSISVPVLDRNASRSGVITAKANLEQERISLEQADLDIKSEVETAWTELERTYEQLESTRLALELAQESLRLAEVGFQEGVTPQLDLLSAQTSLTEARLAHLSSLYNHMLAVTALKVTEGTIIDWSGEFLTFGSPDAAGPNAVFSGKHSD